ncbi:hypothetical protein RKD23_000738 [Streptomyces sp. SAI-170]
MGGHRSDAFGPSASALGRNRSRPGGLCGDAPAASASAGEGLAALGWGGGARGGTVSDLGEDRPGRACGGMPGVAASVPDESLLRPGPRRRVRAGRLRPGMLGWAGACPVGVPPSWTGACSARVRGDASGAAAFAREHARVGERMPAGSSSALDESPLRPSARRRVRCDRLGSGGRHLLGWASVCPVGVPPPWTRVRSAQVRGDASLCDRLRPGGHHHARVGEGMPGGSPSTPDETPSRPATRRHRPRVPLPRGDRPRPATR